MQICLERQAGSIVKPIFPWRESPNNKLHAAAIKKDSLFIEVVKEQSPR